MVVPVMATRMIYTVRIEVDRQYTPMVNLTHFSLKQKWVFTKLMMSGISYFHFKKYNNAQKISSDLLDFCL